MISATFPFREELTTCLRSVWGCLVGWMVDGVVVGGGGVVVG